MCELIKPTFVGIWLVTPKNKHELSSYEFEVERTLNQLSKVGQGSKLEEAFVQCYNVKMHVNHDMSHLCTLKDDHIFKDQEVLLGVMEMENICNVSYCRM
jgi:hypothetical protein